MLEKPTVKKVDKQDGNMPANIEQLIQKYDLEKLWPYIEKNIVKVINDAIDINGSNVAIGQKYDTSEGSAFQVGGSINIPLWDASYRVDGKPLLLSTGKNAILSGNGEAVWIRPNGAGSVSGQAYLDIDGVFHVSSVDGNASSATRTINRGNVAPETGNTKPKYSGITMQNAYNNGYPTTFGNILNLLGGGASQLFLGWEGSTQRGKIFYRSLRDNTSNWSDWGQIPTYETLYNNSSGATGTITLTKSKDNFEYLEIYTDLGTIKVRTSNSDCWATLSQCSDTLYINFLQLKLSGKSITRGNTGVYYLNANHTTTFKVYKVLGYR